VRAPRRTCRWSLEKKPIRPGLERIGGIAKGAVKEQWRRSDVAAGSKSYFFFFDDFLVDFFAAFFFAMRGHLLPASVVGI
jgi:hypothetical protein